MIEVVLSVAILCSGYPYKAGERIPDSVVKHLWMVFNGREVITAKKVNDYCEENLPKKEIQTDD